MANRMPAQRLSAANLSSSEISPSSPRRRGSSDLKSAEANALGSRLRGSDGQIRSPVLTLLGTVADVFVGFPFRSETFSTDGVKLLRGDNISQGHIDWKDAQRLSPDLAADFADYELAEGDIVLAMDRPWVGAGLKFASVREQDAGALLVQRTARVRGTDVARTDFLRYVIAGQAYSKYIKGVTTGSLVPHISKKQIQDFRFFLPRPSIQKNIADVLSALDAKIDLNTRINAELEALAKTIYDYWFVQFDFPDANGRPYKTSGGKMVWNLALKRNLPIGWDAVSIGDACNTILGGTPDTKNSEYWDNADIPWLSSAETSCFPVVSSEQLITSEGIRDSAARLLPAGAVIVSIVRYIRPSILAIAAATNQSVVGILEADIFPSSYLYPAICREVPRWMALRTGAQQPHINKATVDETLILKPEISAVSAYRQIADPIFKRINVAAVENRELMELRDWILPLLMNGQVRMA